MKKVQDHYFKKAKKQGFPARSVYKLEEVQKKHKLLKSGQTVMDLGAFPGSWSKYAAGVVGPKGLVVAVDIQKPGVIADNVCILQQDVYDLKASNLRRISPHFDVMLSDMAPKTTGRKDVDHFRSVALAERALDLAGELLKPGGTLFCKIFQGKDFPSFRDKCRESFSSVRVIKPKSSRPESVEIFLLCTDKKIAHRAASGSNG
ncbi:MAG: RlmE family RNA methyltransferase [Deltaproteobacteria bacterium]|nr:RlmE family RNA methyltransferase [Deltaproteobacteria bacterium]MBW1718356.1 RlmE family RNA methyltransferase [Deltaproteobacteria bacterium]MBW1932385.1 RlmE family RNA methyltransferase [Deltaproteobacteria bacterium]MBW1938517.1 RlmE family RNA methyltransferase [Deltaproteobacteria bacterium]MBW1965190.1 RlmE family RNA methyltransferase [Deltaproteobacteria bacterium]